ncbi:MAG: aspartyl protease family protein [Maricaulaceae bacterium]
MKNVLKFIYLIAAFACFHVAYAQDTFVDITIPHNDFNATPVVDVYIGDKGPYIFAVDTGASSSSITKQLADEIGLQYVEPPTKILTVKDVSSIEITNQVDIYISDKKVHRKTRLHIADFEHELLTKAVGILGVSEMLGGTLVNVPTQKKLILSLPLTNPICDSENELSFCYGAFKKTKTINFSLGSHNGVLLIDTGYSGHTNLVMFKSHETNNIWNQYPDDIQLLNLKGISNLPLKTFRTNDFTYNNKDCSADIIIRNPMDASPLFSELTGIVGWNIISNEDFTIDFKEGGGIDFPNNNCPFKKENTLGLKGVYSSADFSLLFIKNLVFDSAATKAGLKEGDQIEKIILADGNVITKFDHTLFNYNDQHVYAPVGSKVTYFVRRDGVLKPFIITAEGVPVLELD